jgi:hypothetical protein
MLARKYYGIGSYARLTACGGMAVFHLVGDLNGLVGKSPQLFVRNAGKGILDVPTQALLGLVWRGECLSLPKVLPGVIHGPAKCL